MRLLAVLLVTVASVSVVACSGESATPTPSGIQLTTPVADPTATPQPIVTTFEGEVVQFEVNLAMNGSPQQGSAVFTRRNETSHLEMKLSPGGRAQMVTLRRGQCPNPEGFEETFELAIGGVLRQELRDFTIEDLTAGGLTLVVGVDDDTFNAYAACADLPALE